MRLSTLGLAAALSAGLVHDSGAVVRPKGAEPPLVSADRAPRQHRTIEWKPIATAGLAGWTVMWDRDTEVPLRLWGSTQPIFGVVANATLAEIAARRFLDEQLAVLAPGAKSSDFTLVSNVLSPDGKIRSVGFVQHAGGVRVLGGAIGFAFKGDRLSLVSSTSLPNVSAPVIAQRLPAALLATQAERWLLADGHTVKVTSVAAEPVILPIVRPRVGVRPDIQYRVVEQLEVAATDGPGEWQVWVDAASGAPIARKTKLMFASGKVLYDVPDRYPAGMRSGKPAAFMNTTIDGTAATTVLDGTVTWNGAGSATVRVKGPYVSVVNSGSTPITGTLQLMSGGSATWSQASSETGDAQLAAFVHAGIVKQFTKTRINPSLAWLEQALTVSVNESGGCNAFSNGDDIHFLRKNSQCENTARLADVVYHEFGHSLHNHSIIEGVGSWDGALSEGLSDVLAMLITHDSGMGRGFFLSNPAGAMRELNPPNKDKKWGVDTTGEVHDDGEIIGGTFWDLMVALEAQMGQTAGFDKTIDIYYTVMQRASDIPSSYAEALLGDDDDGDLANGTPNKCAVHAAFALHALADGAVPMGTVDKPVRTNFDIKVKAQNDSGGPMSNCPSPRINAGEIAWRVRGGTDATVAMQLDASDNYVGSIPSQPNGTVVQYKVTLTLSNGTKITYPNNAADPYYEWYIGPVTKVWCADFETGAADWTMSMDWESGPALGLGGDPKAAFGGMNVLGSDLSKDGAYAASATSYAESPEIDLGGQTGLRLQMQRWLAVEDGFYDQAKLSINGTEVWKNFKSASDPQQSGVHHIDREWRFADFELATYESTGKLKLRFDLKSDEGLQFGGWTLDDVCVVAAATGPGDANCGNGFQDPNEVCDDGNVNDGDGCSATCQNENDGGDGHGHDDGGCCSVGGDKRGAIALALLTLGLVLRRRRRS
jgi:MYXO-CTERM domain-containing protein